MLFWEAFPISVYADATVAPKATSALRAAAAKWNAALGLQALDIKTLNMPLGYSPRAGHRNVVSWERLPPAAGEPRASAKAKRYWIEPFFVSFELMVSWRGGAAVGGDAQAELEALFVRELGYALGLAEPGKGGGALFAEREVGLASAKALRCAYDERARAGSWE
jgi:hypothetical protein